RAVRPLGCAVSVIALLCLVPASAGGETAAGATDRGAPTRAWPGSAVQPFVLFPATGASPSGATTASYSLALSNSDGALRPIPPRSPAAAGPVHDLAVTTGVTPRLALFARGLMDVPIGREVAGAAFQAGASVLLTRPGHQPLQVSLQGGMMREFSGAT